MSRCKRRPEVQRRTLSTEQTFALGLGTVAFTLRVVDSANAPVAFTVGWGEGSEADELFHLTAGEVYEVSDLKLDQELQLTVDSATATDVAELITWEG